MFEPLLKIWYKWFPQKPATMTVEFDERMTKKLTDSDSTDQLTRTLQALIRITEDLDSRQMRQNRTHQVIWNALKGIWGSELMSCDTTYEKDAVKLRIKITNDRTFVFSLTEA